MVSVSSKTITPSLASLEQIRKEMRRIRRTLRAAYERDGSGLTKGSIQLTLDDLQRRLETVDNTIKKVELLEQIKRKYELKLIEIDQKTNKLIERNLRGASRWLRRWEKL